MALELNGWQRLWVVFSVIGFIGMVTTVAILWPSNEPVEREFFDDVYMLIYKSTGKPGVSPASAYFEEAALRGLLTPQQTTLYNKKRWAELAELAIAKSRERGNRIDFSVVKRKHQRSAQDVQAEQKKLVIRGAFSWFAVIAAIYVLGLSVEWIIRGFRSSRKGR